jgi:hypothetical protein
LTRCKCPRRPVLRCLKCMRQHNKDLKRAAATSRSSARRRQSPSSQHGSTEPRVAAAKHTRSFTHRSLLRRKPNPRGATQRPNRAGPVRDRWETGTSCCWSRCTRPRRLNSYLCREHLKLINMCKHITNLKRAAATSRSSARRQPSPSSQPGSTEPRVAAAKHTRSFVHLVSSLLRIILNPTAGTLRLNDVAFAQDRLVNRSSCCLSRYKCPHQQDNTHLMHICECGTQFQRTAASARSSARRRPLSSSQPGSAETRVAAAKHTRSFTHRPCLLQRKPNPRGATQRPSGLDDA